MSNPKPILKWVGGKTQIISNLTDNFPNEINNYHEVLGGGSVLIKILTLIHENKIKLKGKIYAYDLNDTLIHIYKNIQKNHNQLFEEISKLNENYDSCKSFNGSKSPKNIDEAMESKESYFYWIRKNYNSLSLEDKRSVNGSSMFIFLNKTCFRGLYRIGPNGFNVPFGNYKNPEIINKANLEQLNSLFKDVIFKCQDFTETLKNINKNDFVYLDPPYAPEKQNSFVKYNDAGFNLDNHITLFNLIHELDKKKNKIILSNADVKLVRDNFKDDNYKVQTICKRTINSKIESKTNELIIKNF